MATKKLAELYHQFSARVDFVTIYIFEAHAVDEWHLYRDVCFKQPKTIEERETLAKEYVTRTNLPIPIVCDVIDNTCATVYSAWPERLYCVGKDGKVAYKGDLGPDGYDPPGLKAFLESQLGA